MKRFSLFLVVDIPLRLWFALGKPKGVLDWWAYLTRPIVVWGAADAKSTKQ